HRTPHPDRLTSQAPFAEELTSPEHRHDAFPARLGEHRELHVTLLDVQRVFARIALGEDDLAAPIFHNLSCNPRGVEEGLCVKDRVLLCLHGEGSCKTSAISLRRPMS